MGYLDHSTNNIILDAVLTDVGRQKLASSGDLKIDCFALGDDEVDYRIIKKYGRTVGKEKIEKNTPIFEAMTNANIALKYRLIGQENSNNTAVLSATYLPQLINTSTTPNLTITKDQNGTSSAKVQFQLKYAGSTIVPSAFIQTEYEIKISGRFFTISSAEGGSISPDANLSTSSDPNRTAIYTLKPANNSTSFTLNVNVQTTLDSTTLSIYGKNLGNGARQITSYITVTGKQHGCSLDIPINYKSSL